jgi:hypothetical protein
MNSILRTIIRDVVRETLTESAVSLGQARSEGLALYVSARRPKKYVLYDTQRFIASLRSGDDIGARDAVVAFIQVATPLRGKSYLAKEVKYSAAKKGYGPLLYDIVMSEEGSLVADRHSVSRDAQKIWSYYKDRRPDVRKLPLDDVEDPKTTPVVDDAELHVVGSGDIETDAVNYAYFGGDIDATPLTKSHESAIVESEVHSSDYERALEDATAAFFLLMISRTS